MQNLIERLRHIVGPEYVLTDEQTLQPYLVDWRGRYRGAAACVVRPSSTEQVSEVVNACVAANVPMVPQGGNTGHVGGGIPRQQDAGCVLISMTRLNRVCEIDTNNNTMILEAGCTLAFAQEKAAEHQCLFPLSLAAEGSCQIGGNLSTNAGGIHVLRYGNMRDLTLGLEVVLPDGQVWNGLRGLRKDNTGYDLKQLFIGAEGTLGIITAAVLKLFPLPRSRVVALAAVDDVCDVVDLLSFMREALGERLVAFEMMARPALEMVLKHIPGVSDPFSQRYPWYVLMELTSPDSESALQIQIEETLSAVLEKRLAYDVVMARSEAQAQTLWALRENISEAQRIEGFSIKHDISLPISMIEDFVEASETALRTHFPQARPIVFGHVGDGNLHYNLFGSVNGSRDEYASFMQKTPEVNRLVHGLVNQLGGSISAEHGIGQLKREELAHYKSPVEMALMRSIKNAIDPKGLMNPGKVI